MTILVIVEHDNALLKAATRNTVTAAKALGGELHALVAGSGCARAGTAQTSAAMTARIRIMRTPDQE